MTLSNIGMPSIGRQREIKFALAEEMKKIPETVLQAVKPDYLWINPDCGLKTRQRDETVLPLKNMVYAAKELRKRFRSEDS